MRTIKIKLPFNSEIDKTERNSKLNIWAKTMLRGKKVNIVEEKHLEKMSYIVVENTRTVNR